MTRTIRDKHGAPVSEFVYRGIDCEVRQVTWLKSFGAGAHNGYMTGPFTITSYDEADEVAEAHGGFTYDAVEDDGRVTLGFDTLHGFDDAGTQSEEYVTQAIKDAVDSLYAAGVVDESKVQA